MLGYNLKGELDKVCKARLIVITKEAFIFRKVGHLPNQLLADNVNIVPVLKA